MAKKKSYKKKQKRKSFLESFLEWILFSLKRLLIPGVFIWLIAWLWLGGVFAKGYDMAWQNFVLWTKGQDLVVTNVMIEGRHRTDIQALNKAILVKPGDALLGVNIEIIQERLEELLWVKSSTIGRHYNGIVTVQIAEKIPFVLWQRPGRGIYLVDIEGEIIEGAKTDKFKKLLLVKGVDAPKHAISLMQMVTAEPEVTKRVRAAEWIGNRRWDLITNKGIRIHLPEDDIGFAISRLAKAISEKDILSQKILSIDLRGTDRIIIETERGQSQDLMTLSSPSKTKIL